MMTSDYQRGYSDVMQRGCGVLDLEEDSTSDYYQGVADAMHQNAEMPIYLGPNDTSPD